MRSWTFLFSIGFLFAGVALSATTAYSQNKKPEPKVRVFNLGDQEVEGTVRKPLVMIMLNKKHLKFDSLNPKKSFLPLIIKSVDKPPF